LSRTRFSQEHKWKAVLLPYPVPSAASTITTSGLSPGRGVHPSGKRDLPVARVGAKLHFSTHDEKSSIGSWGKDQATQKWTQWSSRSRPAAGHGMPCPGHPELISECHWSWTFRNHHRVMLSAIHQKNSVRTRFTSNLLNNKRHRNRSGATMNASVGRDDQSKT
jgi:hypothetical protein